MNWLALKALKQKYAAEEGPHKEQALKIYKELRKNVIDNVYKEQKRTGFVWEQYHADTGEAKGAQGFTGWTSLVTLIMTETY